MWCLIPGCLHRRVESQQIGLKGNLIDGFDDLLGFHARLGDLFHGAGQFRHGTAGAVHHDVRPGHEFVRLAGIIRVLQGEGRHFLQGGRSFFQGGGLFRGPFGQGLAG